MVFLGDQVLSYAPRNIFTHWSWSITLFNIYIKVRILQDGFALDICLP